MEDNNHTYASFEKQYHFLRNHVRLMEPPLKLLHLDFILGAEQHYKVNYAVDFHEIWEFANPVYRSMGTDRKIQTPSEEDVQVKQIARAGLFYGLEPGNHSVLLPPYVTELNNKVALVKSGVLEMASRLGNEYTRKLNNIVNEETVRNALDEFRKSNRLSPELVNQLQVLLEERVGELFYLISGAAGKGLEIIRSLLTENPPIVHMSSSRWPELDSFIQEIMQMPESEWYQRFKMIRPSERDVTSNLHDSKAIDLVLALNQRFMQEQRKEIVFIVSDTRTMARILKEKPSNFSNKVSKNYTWTEEDGICIEIPGIAKPVPIFRPIEEFYYSILFRDDASKAGTLRNIENELRYIFQVDIWLKSFHELLENCGKCFDEKNRMMCKISNPCFRMQDELLDYNKNFSDRRNILLAVNRFPVLKPFWERVEAQLHEFETRLDKSVLILIEYLSQPISSLEGGIKKRERELFEFMESDLKDALIETINPIIAVSSNYEKEISEGLDKFSRTHYRIHFTDEVVVDTLDRLEKARYAGNVYSTAEAIKTLINQAFERSLGLERWLLWVVLLICYRLLDRAINLATLMLRDAGTAYRAEYLYLRALAYYEGRHFRQVIRECQTDISEYAGDARFYNLCGLAISRLLETSDDADFSWDDAIEYATQAYTIVTKFRDDFSLQGTIANNLAYFFFRRGKSNDLQKALHYSLELQRLIPSSEEIPEYLNTIGCVYKDLALREEDRTKRERYKIKALNDLKKAYELAKTTIVDKDEVAVYEQDLQNAQEQLGELTPK